jgi:hypothetical protein
MKQCVLSDFYHLKVKMCQWYIANLTDMDINRLCSCFINQEDVCRLNCVTIFVHNDGLHRLCAVITNELHGVSSNTLWLKVALATSNGERSKWKKVAALVLMQSVRQHHRFASKRKRCVNFRSLFTVRGKELLQHFCACEIFISIEMETLWGLRRDWEKPRMRI